MASWLQQPDKLAIMSDNARSVAMPYATLDIASELCDMLELAQ